MTPTPEQLAEWAQLQQAEDERVAALLALVNLPPELAAAIRTWHEAVGWNCCAAGEGQRCCVDDLLER